MPPGRSCHRLCGEFVFPGAAGCDSDPYVAREAQARLGLCADLHGRFGRGAMLGYAIGAFLFETVGKWLINLYGYGARVDQLRLLYAQWGWAVILLKGFTPIPFKIVTITSGFWLIVCPCSFSCAFSRAGRGFSLSRFSSKHYGEPIKALLDKYFGWFLAILAAAIVVASGLPRV